MGGLRPSTQTDAPSVVVRGFCESGKSVLTVGGSSSHAMRCSSTHSGQRDFTLHHTLAGAES